MGLFDLVTSAIDNPETTASQSQIGSIVGALGQLSGHRGASDPATQAVLSVLGKQIQSSLSSTRTSRGDGEVEALVDRFSGTNSDSNAVQALFSSEQEQQVSQLAAQKSGLDPAIIRQMLPVLVPIALKLLQSGSRNANTRQSANLTDNNSVLASFLDSDGDGDFDMGDALGMAAKFMR